MNITFTTYTDEYADQVMKLFENFQDYLIGIDPIERTHRMPGYGPMILKKTLADVASKEGVFYLCLNGQVVIGFIVAVIVKQTEEEKLEIIPSQPGRITELYVDTAYRKQGIATQLMAMAEKYLKDHGCDVVWVGVFDPNTPARNLYKKLGYATRLIDVIKKLT